MPVPNVIAMTTIEDAFQPSGTAPANGRRSLADFFAPLERIAAESPNLTVHHDAHFKFGGQNYELTRYLFVGPEGGDTPIHIGVFAGVHGDEPEGSHALVKFIRMLDARPELAGGYCLSFYPICNPTGFEDGTRFSRSGKDLNREFWKNSGEPEVRLLQTELISRSFQGIISLHTDDTSAGFYGYARGATLTKHLLKPALEAVEGILARDTRPIIDGFRARNGIIYDAYEGMLSFPPPRVRPRPFEIILETSAAPPAYLKEAAFIAALQTILVEYRKFIAYAPNL
ncbi:MAG TPA: succinylglutamate desuccinylase/aspartoacylase family protein [Alphaproteobacteria bacterium]|nr:succinylglutamate desuccinylase/aspartoacylase family protein [Alphaproteobacteria bacterium]